MSSREHPGTMPVTTGRPRYPHVRVRLSGTTDVHIVIGKVAVALRRQIGDAAADAFNTTAQQCNSADEVLQLVKQTVRTS
jgi:hypothetical protein